MSCNSPMPSDHTLGAPMTQDAIAGPPRTSRTPDWSLQTSAHKLKAQTQSDAEKHMDTELIDILSGDDGAVHCSSTERREIAGRRRGAVPFIARRVLEGTDDRYCPTHDLESTFYLTFWVAAYILKHSTNDKGLLGDIRIYTTKLLQADCWDELPDCAVYRDMFLRFWSFLPVNKIKTEYFGAFAPFTEILCESAKLGRRWYEKSLYHEDDATMLTSDEIEQAFAEYLDVYEKYMPTEESWDYSKGLKLRERNS